MPSEACGTPLGWSASNPSSLVTFKIKSCRRKTFGSLAICVHRPIALRPCLAAGLPFRGQESVVINANQPYVQFAQVCTHNTTHEFRFQAWNSRYIFLLNFAKEIKKLTAKAQSSQRFYNYFLCVLGISALKLLFLSYQTPGISRKRTLPAYSLYPSNRSCKYRSSRLVLAMVSPIPIAAGISAHNEPNKSAAPGSARNRPR